MKKPYMPPQKILERYADVMVNFALRSGEGIRKGDVVLLNGSEVSKPLYIELIKAVRKAGGHVIGKYTPDDTLNYIFDREFFMNATDEQIKFFPSRFMRGQVDEVDHYIGIIAETNPQALKGINPKKMMMRELSWKKSDEWYREKENKGKFTWSICVYGTLAMAKEAGLSEREYWDQIIKGCLLDKNNPVAEWKKLYKQIKVYEQKLNNLKIEKLHIKGPDADLWVKVGEKRIWKSGEGRNIPSFELFTSPDWRGTDGWIQFNQPLYRYGNLIKGVELWFKNGRVVKSKATKNHNVLKAMIASPNADKVGEYSLTDNRFSRITKFMADTLFDENIGGKYGNTHLALGSAYHDCYAGDPGKVSKKEWARLGYNDSSVHTDIVSTTPRTVTAYLPGGKTKVIYKNGQFTL